MSDVYRDKVAIVTGAASGIGRALSEGLRRRGAKVWMTDVVADRLEQAAKEVGASEWRVLDVTDAEAFEALAGEVRETSGSVDYLFNNAGIAVIGHYHEMQPGDVDKLIDVNLRGVFHGVHAVYPLMREQGSGHIVNTSSVSGLIPAPGFTAYSATKHAVVGLSRGLRIEAKRFGVKVSVICPGFTNTAIIRDADYRGIEGGTAKDKLPFKFDSPENCAREALDGVAKNKGEIVTSKHARGMVAAHRVSPRLLGWLASAGAKRVD